jgi:O-methyltransferase
MNDNFATRNWMGFLDEPKFERSFESALNEVPSALQEQFCGVKYRAHIATWAATHALRVPGDFIEVGVWWGVLSKTILEYNSPQISGRRFYLVDPWGGVVGTRYSENIFNKIEERFSDYQNVHLVKGLAPQILSSIKIEKIAYLSIDMNNFQAEVDCLKFLYPLLSPGAVVYLDDYAHLDCFEVRREIGAFLDVKGENLLIFPSGNAIFIKK